MGSYCYQETIPQNTQQFLRKLDTDHLYRHLSEVIGKETRGGYIEGQLEFSDDLLASPFCLRIILISDVHPKTLPSGRLHPNLLYMTRFEGKTRRKDLESPPMWRVDLEIRDGLVKWWTESEAQALYSQVVCHLKPDPGGRGVMNTLDLRDLHLTVITPLVRTNVNGIKVKDALAKRKALFENLEEHEWEDVLMKLDKFYTNKENKSEMDKICLQFNLHRIQQSEDGEDKEEPWFMSQPLISDPICNSKSRSLGILDLIPNTISAQKACSKNSRTIYLPSKFKLPPSEKAAYPRFVVKNLENEYLLDSRLRQPVDVKIFAFQIFIFKTPIQDENLLQQIFNEGGKIFLEAYRPKDKTSSNMKFEFEFKVHSCHSPNMDQWDQPLSFCSICLEDPDKLVSELQTECNLKEVLKTSGLAKPGTKRRRRDGGSLMYPTCRSSYSADSPLSVSSDSGVNMQPVSPPLDASTELFQAIEESDFDTTKEDPENFNIDELLNNNTAEMPDVLIDVMDRAQNKFMQETYEFEAPTFPCPRFSPEQLPPGASAPILSSSQTQVDCIRFIPVTLEPETEPEGTWKSKTEPDDTWTSRKEPDDTWTSKSKPRTELEDTWTSKSMVAGRRSLFAAESFKSDMEIQSSIGTPKRQLSRGTPMAKSVIVPNYVTLQNDDEELVIERKPRSLPQSMISMQTTRPHAVEPTVSPSSNNDQVKEDEGKVAEVIQIDSTLGSSEHISESEGETIACNKPRAPDDSGKSSTFTENDSSDGSIDGPCAEPKVIELTRKFGGAKKKYMKKFSKIRNQSKGEPELEKIQKEDRRAWLPAIVYMMTPGVVIIVALMIQFILSILDSGESLDPSSAALVEE